MQENDKDRNVGLRVLNTGEVSAVSGGIWPAVAIVIGIILAIIPSKIDKDPSER